MSSRSQINVKRLNERAQQRREQTCTGCGKLHEPASWELVDLETGNTVAGTDDYEQVLAWGQDPDLKDDTGLLLVEFDADGMAYDIFAPAGPPTMNRALRRQVAKGMAARRGPNGKSSGVATRLARRALADALKGHHDDDEEAEAEEAAPVA